MVSTFVESPAMTELFDRTIRHVPTGRFDAPLLVRPSAERRPTIVLKGAEYLVRSLVRRLATEAGAEVRASMLPAEAALRRVFPVRRFRPYLKDWCDRVNDARAVFREFADGGEVARGSLLNACQSMALLETLLRTDNMKYDPARIDMGVNRELLAIWDTLDAQGLLAPRSLAILHPYLSRAGTLGTGTANLLIDGTLIDVKTVVTPAMERSFLRLLVGKAAQAQLGGVLPKGDGREATPVERVALLFTRQNRLIEFGIDELFGADGWERYLDGFAELAAITREREMEPDGMSMTA